jgi:hypothetical protein
MVVDRRELKATLARALRFMGAAPRAAAAAAPPSAPTGPAEPEPGPAAGGA